jgi:hypothetical protein
LGFYEKYKIVEIKMKGKVTEQVFNFAYLGYLIPNDDDDDDADRSSINLQRYNKMNGTIKGSRDSAVGIATGYVLDDRRIRV